MAHPMASRMMRVFKGFELKHYTADFLNAKRKESGKLVPEYEAVNGPVRLEEWEAHLSGVKGLVIVPITPEGLAYWAKIDVDDYKIDPARVVLNIRTHKLPLVVELTKSGGVHLAFYPKKPWPAVKIREQMVAWAAELGFSRSEIFPKQDKLDVAKDSGSCINIPYFGGDEASNYALSPDGQKMTVEQWLDAIESMSDKPGHVLGIANVASAADFLAQYWTEGRRDRMNIAVIGTLLRAGIDESAVESLVEAVKQITGDYEDARKTVAHVSESISTDTKKIPGFAKLTDPVEDLMPREAALELLRMMGAKPPPDPISLPFITIPDEWMDEAPEALRHVIEPLLPQRTVGLLIAEGGTGKTTFAMRLSLCVVTGRPFFGMDTVQGSVCYIALEDRRESLRRRFYWLYQREVERMRREGSNPEAIEAFRARVKDALQLVPGAGQQLHLVTLLGGVAVQSPQVNALIEKIPEGTSLIVLDPIARMNGADENSNAAGTALINAAELIVEKTGASVLMPHHTGKAAAKDRDPGQYAARGASALVDAARSVIRMLAVSPEEAARFTNCPPEIAEEGGLIKVMHVKSNEGRKADPFFLRRQALDFELFEPAIASEAERSTGVLRALFEWAVRAQRAWCLREIEEADGRREVFGERNTPSRNMVRSTVRGAMVRGDVIEAEETRGRGQMLLRFRPGYELPAEEM